MSFKIVQTIERGKACLWTVPEAWENGGIVKWPKTRMEKYRRDPTSVPEDNWNSMDCQVKRSNLRSFQSSESEITYMSGISDTDQEIIMTPQRTITQTIDPNFNDFARSCIRTQSQESKNIEPMIDDATLQLGMEADNISEFFVLPTPAVRESRSIEETQAATCEINQTFNIQIAELNLKIDNLSSIVSEIPNLINIVSILSQNQETIMMKLSEIGSTIDEFIKRSSDSHKSNQHIMEPTQLITNKQILDNFEESLKNKENLEYNRKKFTIVCGQGKGRAINNAYALMDALFDRSFLKQCSWAGGSRGNDPKICFKSYVNTIDFFFQIIYASDKQFTKTECNNFLQNVLRNAKKRSEAKKLKASCQKRRQIRKNKDQHISVDSVEENDYELVSNDKDAEPRPAVSVTKRNNITVTSNLKELEEGGSMYVMKNQERSIAEKHSAGSSFVLNEGEVRSAVKERTATSTRDHQAGSVYVLNKRGAGSALTLKDIEGKSSFVSEREARTASVERKLKTGSVSNLKKHNIRSTSVQKNRETNLKERTARSENVVKECEKEYVSVTKEPIKKCELNILEKQKTSPKNVVGEFKKRSAFVMKESEANSVSHVKQREARTASVQRKLKTGSVSNLKKHTIRSPSPSRQKKRETNFKERKARSEYVVKECEKGSVSITKESQVKFSSDRNAGSVPIIKKCKLNILDEHKTAPDNVVGDFQTKSASVMKESEADTSSVIKENELGCALALGERESESVSVVKECKARSKNDEEKNEEEEEESEKDAKENKEDEEEEEELENYPKQDEEEVEDGELEKDEEEEEEEEGRESEIDEEEYKEQEEDEVEEWGDDEEE